MNDRLDGVETLSREQQSNVAAMHSIRTELNLEIPRMQVGAYLLFICK